MINLPKSIRELFEEVEEYGHIEYSIEDEPRYIGSSIEAVDFFLELLSAEDHIYNDSFNYEQPTFLLSHKDYDFIIGVEVYSDSTAYNHFYVCEKLNYEDFEVEEYYDYDYDDEDEKRGDKRPYRGDE